MILDLTLVILSLALLYFGADWLVSGSAGLARRFNIPPLVIGLTLLVAFLLFDGEVDRLEGAVLCGGILVYSVGYLDGPPRSQPAEMPEADAKEGRPLCG